MTRSLIITGLLLMTIAAGAQVPIRIILPSAPLVEGEPFRIQYVVSYATSAENFSSPDFRKLRVVTGPEIYAGEASAKNKFHQSKNYVFTLEARMPGNYSLPPARVIVDGKLVMSEGGTIRVLSKEEAFNALNKETAGNSEYFLRPGEDVNEKIRQNLFMKLLVDKKSCYVGEPVMATFKLYSRLESRSDIVKNPGFYGFSVFDMINLTDKLVTTETVNGKTFDVHTIRKVQLYPLQAGTFTIDPMELKNEVEFSRSSVSKKTEQEIVEGVLGHDDAPAVSDNTTVVEHELSTDPVNINVKPVPGNPPAAFSGAVGKFNIQATVPSVELAKNEEGYLNITINGTGNFIQLNAPVIHWPQGIEGFEPAMKDSFDKNLSPVTGKREFHFPFVVSTAGSYTIPPVQLTFFNPDSGRYTTISTSTQQITVGNQTKKIPAVTTVTKTSTGSKKHIFLYAGIAVILITGAGIWITNLRKKKAHVPVKMNDSKANLPSVDEFLIAARMNLQTDDRSFYSSLHKGIWDFFKSRLSLTGSDMNKEKLAAKLDDDNVSVHLVKEIQDILTQCEAGQFTNASLANDKTMLLQRAETTLKTIHAALL